MAEEQAYLVGGDAGFLQAGPMLSVGAEHAVFFGAPTEEIRVGVDAAEAE